MGEEGDAFERLTVGLSFSVIAMRHLKPETHKNETNLEFCRSIDYWCISFQAQCFLFLYFSQTTVCRQVQN